MRAKKNTRPNKLFINIYWTTRAYGGPEEGGWWCDCYEPATRDDCGPGRASKQRRTLARAYVAREQARAWCENENRKLRFSRTCGRFVALLERHPPRYCSNYAPWQ